jgi:rhodanese-related sulfurtransferase
MKQMNVVELASLRANGLKPTMIDVREERELVNGVLDDAIHMPMNEVPGRMTDLEAEKENMIVLICRTGNRSNQVGMFLEQNGFNDVVNMVGGMNAWAEKIDPSMTVY